MWLIALILMSSQSLAADSCIFDTIPANSGDFVSQLEKLALQACSELQKDEHLYPDREKLQKKSFKSCCKRANDFISKNPQACSDSARLKAKIDLAIRLCDKIDDHDLGYQRVSCWSTTTFLIGNAQINAKEPACSKKREKYLTQPHLIDEASRYEIADQIEGDCIHSAMKDVERNLTIESLNLSSGSCPDTRASGERFPAKAGALTGGASPAREKDSSAPGF